MTEFVQFVSPYLPAHIFDIIMVPMQIILLLFTLYFFFIGFCCLWRRREQKILTPEKTFAVVVAAHNEAAVIGQLIENLKRLDYPEELYDIYVIADNCTDETAQIAGDAGAIVCERTHPTKKSKGFALEWMFERLFEMDKEYDAIAIFDADNLVHPNFLKEMNNRLLKGDKVIQGFLDAKNPYDTWVAGTFAIAFWVIDHISHLAKTNMTFKQAWNQRRRWAQGQFDVAHRFIPTMIREGWKRRDIRIWDGCIYLLQPHFLMMSTFFIIISYVQLAFPPFYTSIYKFLPSQLMTAIMIGQYVLPMIILIKVRAKLKAWFYLLLYPVFIYSWIPIIFLGFIHRNEHEWSHTKHTRAMSMDEVMSDVK